MDVKVQHAGNDGGKIKDIVLWTAHRTLSYSFRCSIQEKLDHDESATATCNRDMAKPYQYLNKTCNGNETFCNLEFNEFTFPGTHNSGTGMKRTVWVADCHYKNQDMDMTEMLDFGVRFFDFDTKYK